MTSATSKDRRSDTTQGESDSDRNKGGGGANTAPDAVKDPNEKTDGKPGVPPGAGDRGGEADPGGG